jgi:O-6-methylguanine DNA methyltransferase
MTDMERLLAELNVAPPDGLERDTLVNSGVADLVAITDSPFGPLWISWSPRGVTGVSPLFATPTTDDFLEHHTRRCYPANRLPVDLADITRDALEHGTSPDFPVDLRDVSTFQRAVLDACRTIEAGTVRSYGWIAQQLANPGAVRAVGTALGHNPIPLLIPCHRVVRSDGSVGSYAFGPDMKHDLLVSEGAILA